MHVVWFKDLGKDSVAIAGGKGANLGEMWNARFPIPPGFMVTAQAYGSFIDRTKIRDKILSILKDLNVEDTDKLQTASEQIKKLIIATPIPEDIQEAIMDAYDILGLENKPQAAQIMKGNEEFVAVRSSATAEDLPSISADEHILVTVNGRPVYRKMRELEWLRPEKDVIKIPALENNEIAWKQVSAVYRHPANDSKLYRITTRSGRRVTISANHSIIILDEATLRPKTAKIAELNGNEKVPAICKLPEINCADLSLDVLDYVKGTDVEVKEEKVYIKNKSSNWIIQSPLPQRITYSEDFAYFLGLYIAEGSTYESNEITITNQDTDVMNRCIQYIKELGLYDNQKINKHSLRIYCKTLVRLLHAITGEPLDIKGKGKLSRIKKVPDFVFGWNVKLIGEFLKGAFDGDGGVETCGISYSSTSPLLIGGIVKLIETIGLQLSIEQRKSKNPRWQDHQRIAIPAKDAAQFQKKIGFESKRKQEMLERLLKRYEQMSKHPGFMHTIKINPELSKLMKQMHDLNLENEEVIVPYCILCEKKIEKTSPYQGKPRFYCHSCHKSFYNAITKKEMRYKYYDENGRFRKETKPWNRAKLSGTMSQTHFNRIVRERNVDMNIFGQSVLWDQIKTIEELPYQGYVYDFTVPDVENFAAGVGGIITHNSASFAGQQETFLNIKGKSDVVEAVRKCWASLFTARAIYYRQRQNFPTEKVLIAVVIQKMVNSEKAGVMFTINPATNEGNEIIIEGAFGLGEAVVSGAVNPDLYIVDKRETKIKTIEVKDKKLKIIRDANGKNIEKRLSPEEEKRQVLTDKEIIELARYGKRLEQHYNHPQDVEWAIEKEKVYIVQTRAVTTFKIKEQDKPVEHSTEEKVLLRGETACKGIASGPVRIILTAKELHNIQEGDVMVTTMTDPDMVPGMQKAAAIITDEGGMTSHAAIVSREMGTPCIVGTETATQVLKENQIVTVDATQGIIYTGKVERKDYGKQVNEVQTSQTPPDPITGTQVKVIMDFPNRAEQIAKETNADGVGLLRLEFIIAAAGKHPAQYMRENKDEEYITLLTNEIGKIARAFKGKPVWARCSDLRSDEYRNLEGGDQEPHETDPMIGWHGIRRLLDEPRILKAEFKAVKRLHDQGLTNVGIMLPFVIRAEEVKKAKEYLLYIFNNNLKSIKFGVMIETPAACWVIEDICKVGIDFISFGTNDLTQTTLGLDRNNQRIQKHFSEMHPAVLGEIAMVIKTCKKYGVETSICGQAASNPEMAEFLVREGIDSVSPNYDVIHQIRHIVAQTERKLLLEIEQKRAEQK